MAVVGEAETFTIGEVARRTGMSVHALRYYERNGLLAIDVARTSAGHRRYRPADVEWIDVCCQLRRSGMPLAALREYVGLIRHGAGNEQQRLAVLRRHETHVRGKIGALQASLALISYKVSFYEQRIADGTATTVWAAQ